jgi:tetratricopeptide (TPR) repeat protein
VKQLPPATFLPLLREAVDAAPRRTDLQLQLARTLLVTDRMPELVDRFRAAVRDAGADPELLFLLGGAARATGEEELALVALRSSVARGFVRAWGALAEALHRAGRADEALATARLGLDASPSDYASLRIVALVLAERGEHERLWAVCADLRRRGAYGGYLPSVMALAATTPEERGEVTALVDPARWLRATRPAVPRGFDERLAAELLAHPGLAPLPASKATTGAGNRIDRLQQVGGPLARELLRSIGEAVDAYAAARGDAASHPMIAYRPASTRMNAWAVIVREDGHEDWHVHPDGWLSGVYYVSIPPPGPGAGQRAGTIEFGPHPFAGRRAGCPWRRRSVAPRTGMLLLFPSYYAHRTYPTGTAEPRVCVAFDVVPAMTDSSSPGEPG